MQTDFRLGARYQGRSRTSFCVWAPRAEQTAVHLLEPSDRLVALERTGGGYCCGIVEEVEHGEAAPFPYFVSHSDPELIEAVRRGRHEEFRSFQWKREPPDPQAEATFEPQRAQPRAAGKRPLGTGGA